MDNFIPLVNRVIEILDSKKRFKPTISKQLNDEAFKKALVKRMAKSLKKELFR
jgi:hypothetical protein